MWEFLITVNASHRLSAEKIYNTLKKYSAQYGSVVTTYEQSGEINIVVSCYKADRKRFSYLLMDILAEIICTDFKQEFLMSKLNLPHIDDMTNVAFMQALLSFDKETDRYIVSKYLNLEDKINLNSFYFFILRTLREKWHELVEIANENKAYLSSKETYVELIKFLVDNLEIKNEVVNVVEENSILKFYDSNYNPIEENQLNKENENCILKYLIELSPKRINIYCADKIEKEISNLISLVFDKRVNFLSNENILRV